MKKERKLKVVVSALVCTMVFLTAASGMIYAAQGDSKEAGGADDSKAKSQTAAETSVNDQTVYVLTDAKGREQQRIVSEKGNLHYDGYEKASLPVTMEIGYTLDGKAVEAEKLAGKSGHLEMTLRYTNHENQGGVYVPFLAVSGMVLPNETFSNVEMINGKLISDGNRTVAVGYALPGFAESLGTGSLDIPETVTLSADVKNFKMETIYTLVTSGIFTDMDLANAGDLGDIADSLGGLSDGVSQLLSGTKALHSGTQKLTDGAKQLAKGTETLKNGAGELASGTDALLSGTGQLKDGADGLAQGAQQLEQGSQQLSAGADQLTAGLSQISANSASLNVGAQQLVAATLKTAETSLGAAGLSVTLTTENYHQVLQQAAAAKPEAAQQLGALESQIEQVIQFHNGLLAYTAGVDTAAAGAGEISENLKILQQGAAQIYSGAVSLRDGQQQVYDGAKALQGGAGALADGTALLCQKEQELVSGASELEKGAGKLYSGISEMTDKMSAQLSKLSPGELAKALDRMQAMERAAEHYNGFGTHHSYDSVKFIFKAEEITEEK